MTGKQHLLCAILISTVLRGILFFQIYPDTGIISAQDQRIYIQLSEYLMSNLNFGAEFGSERLPLYPLFISLCLLLYDSLFFVLIMQNIIGLVSIIVLYRVGALFSRRIAVLSAYFAAVNLNFVVESNLILTESLFYPLFGVFFFYLVRFVQKKQNHDILMSVLILGGCTLIRPVTMYLPVFLIIYLAVLPRMQIRKKITLGILVMVLFVSVISPWLYRNHVVYNKIGLTTQGASHMAGWVIPYVMQYEDNLDLAAAKKKSMSLWQEKMKTLPEENFNNPFQLDKQAKKYGFSYLLEASPASIFQAWFWGGMKNIFSPVTVELAFLLDMDRTLFGESSGKNVPEQLFNFIFKNQNKIYGMLMVFGILGILFFRSLQLAGSWRAWHYNKEIVFIMFLVGAYFLIVSGPVGYAKYRIPLEPVFILLSAFCFKEKKQAYHNS